MAPLQLLRYKKHFTLFLFCTWTILSYGQNIGASEIDESSVTAWVEQDLSKYHGVYHFDEGDGSNLILLVTDSAITVQIRETGYWVGGGYAVEAGIAKLSELDLKWEYKNLSQVAIADGKFHSDQYEGEFVTYTDSTGVYSGLKIDNSWNNWVGKNRYEVGIKQVHTEMTRCFPGKYPQASTRFLASSDLDKLTKEDLKIVRNEIFARYDYSFARGSEMDIHFRQQEWYRPRYADVSSFLTDIELTNIALIKTIEHIK